jgi:PAS domain-containing protein
MLMIDKDLIITDANEQALKLTGVGRQALIGSRFDINSPSPNAPHHRPQESPRDLHLGAATVGGGGIAHGQDHRR